MSCESHQHSSSEYSAHHFSGLTQFLSSACTCFVTCRLKALPTVGIVDDTAQYCTGTGTGTTALDCTRLH